PKDSEKYFGLLRVDAVNGLDPETAKRRPYFEQLTPIFPDEMVHLEEGVNNLSTRVIDLVAPVGRGQRGLIVSPPKAGKTLLLKTIASATAKRYEDIHIMVVLVGERPEEVTDWRRSVEDAEVVAATFDDAFEEFKATGNWEPWLDRRLSEKRVFPAIDIARSGTRRDELLLDEKTYQRVVLLRRMTALVGQNSQNSTEPTELILERLSRTKSNAEFLSTLKDAI